MSLKTALLLCNAHDAGLGLEQSGLKAIYVRNHKLWSSQTCQSDIL